MKRLLITFFLVACYASPAWGQNGLALDKWASMTENEQTMYISGFLAGVCAGGAEALSFLTTEIKENDYRSAHSIVVGSRCEVAYTEKGINFTKMLLRWATTIPEYKKSNVEKILMDHTLWMLIDAPSEIVDDVLRAYEDGLNKQRNAPPAQVEKPSRR